MHAFQHPSCDVSVSAFAFASCLRQKDSNPRRN
jgi:hypothetical protein